MPASSEKREQKKEMRGSKAVVADREHKRRLATLKGVEWAGEERRR